jgi:porin
MNKRIVLTQLEPKRGRDSVQGATVTQEPRSWGRPWIRVVSDIWKMGENHWRAVISIRIQQVGMSLGIALQVTFAGMHAANANSLSNWLEQPTMTGDWGGVRTSLEALGITLRASYGDEFAANPIGGKRQGQSSAQQFAFGVDLDMGKLAGITGGTIHISLNDRMGRSDSAVFVGNELEDQSDFGAGQNFRLAQFSYEQLFAKGKIDAQIGFLADFGYSFGFTPLLCDFENVGFCGHPFVLFVDSGVSAYPTAQWGGMVKFNLSSTLYAESGAFEVNPSRLDVQNGFNVSLNGSTGALVPVELGWTAAIGPDKLPGHYKIGGYYDTSTTRDVALSDIDRSGRYGGYILVDQMLFRFKPGTGRGLIAFAQGTISDDRTSPIPYSYNAGLILQGPFASRARDYVALGVVHEPVNNRILKEEEAELVSEESANVSLQQGETDVELGYGLSVAPWLMINPNVQYIIDPGAFSFTHVENAWVFGLQTKVTF